MTSSATRSFDGSNDFIDISGSNAIGSNLNLSGGPCSFTAWVYQETGNLGSVIGKRDGASSNRQYHTFTLSSPTTFDIANNTTTKIGQVIPFGEWVFTAFTLDGSDVPSLSVNGGAKTSLGGTLPFTYKSINVSIGSRWNSYPTPAYVWDGQLSNVCVYNIELSLPQIKEIMWKPGSVTDGLVMNLPCYGVDSTEPDLSGNGNVGTVTGATASSNCPPVFL